MSSGSSATVTGTSQTMAACGLDQFGNAMPTQPSFAWSTTVVPPGRVAADLRRQGGTHGGTASTISGPME